MDHVRVRLLGGFGVEVGGEVVHDQRWETRRSRQLVALLALAPVRRTTAEAAMDALWPDLDPAAARANLHKAASLARRALGGRSSVVFREGTVALWPDAVVEVDVTAFEAAADLALGSGDDGACAAAAARFTGDLLPDERYEDWAAPRRERLARLHLDLLRAGGQWSTVVEVDPTDEAAHRR
ncbi:MAG TPA: hypothetical protein VFO65_13370 [Acidimicrobiales bacterium]|nr:hypothetical protein [Acidimicrobiales bacterium]